MKDQFDTIWRAKFNPHLVEVPRDKYRDHLPQADVIPWAVYDDSVIEQDGRFQKALGKSLDEINEIVVATRPHEIRIPIRQLIRQAPAIVSGVVGELLVFRGRQRIKTVSVSPRLRQLCKRIQSILLERLLLFEDLQGILPSDEFDGWADETDFGHTTSTHRFARGAKIDALVQIVTAASADSKKTVIFVRNIPVCEAVAHILESVGFAVEFAHGQLENTKRMNSVGAFRSGKADVLVVTRALFGRGFDIPQADIAIFYSPKEDERTMWQEMLRIRSTVTNPKFAFVLFYAWTAESAKMGRLIEGMMSSGAQWKDDALRWVYSEDRVGPAKSLLRVPRPHKAKTDEFGNPTKTFVERLLQGIVHGTEKEWGNMREMWSLSEQTGFISVWPENLVRLLLFQVEATIKQLVQTKKTSLRDVQRAFAKILHPDKHPNTNVSEKQFWHELFIALGM